MRNHNFVWYTAAMLSKLQKCEAVEIVVDYCVCLKCLFCTQSDVLCPMRPILAVCLPVSIVVGNIT